MYSVYTRKIHQLLPPGCLAIEFADDIAILFRSNDPTICKTTLQQCLNSFAVFLSARGLELCPEITKLVLFNKLKLKLDKPRYSLNLNNFIIKPSLYVKFLGITLDFLFTFNEYFKYLIDKLRKTLRARFTNSD